MLNKQSRNTPGIPVAINEKQSVAKQPITISTSKNDKSNDNIRASKETGKIVSSSLSSNNNDTLPQNTIQNISPKQPKEIFFQKNNENNCLCNLINHIEQKVVVKKREDKLLEKDSPYYYENPIILEDFYEEKKGIELVDSCNPTDISLILNDLLEKLNYSRIEDINEIDKLEKLKDNHVLFMYIYHSEIGDNYNISAGKINQKWYLFDGKKKDPEKFDKKDELIKYLKDNYEIDTIDVWEKKNQVVV